MAETNRTAKSFRNNRELARLFHRMADCYRYLGREEQFRALAYENASRVLQNMNEDIASYATDVKKLDGIGGIGESIAQKIIEYLRNGKITAFEKLKKTVPFELLELMEITGFGPATLKLLHDRSGINNREELAKALEAGTVKGIPGIGKKKIANMKSALKLNDEGRRMPLKTAERTGNEILAGIRGLPGVQKAELAGSLRRKKETIGDIDIVVLAEPRNRKMIINSFIRLPQIGRILLKGSTRVSVVLKKDQVQVDLRLVNDYEYGAAMLYFTGSKEHNIKLRTMARNKGYKINEYGVFDVGTGKRMAGATEEEIYHFLGMGYIPPEQRLDKGEIEKALLKPGTN